LFVDRFQIRQRGRAPLEVKDEYDVQDLLHAILRLRFDNVRPEEVTPSYAGNASRVGFYLPHERIIVEAKKTRNNLGQKEVANELVIDAARYAQMPAVDTLICVVYDPGRKYGNPRTLENDVEASAGRLKVRAVVCPQGL
jgi:REase_DpnII-MboI